MTPLEFLRAVLPSPGNGYYATFSGQSKRHWFSQEIERVVDTALNISDKKHDAYFALATFEVEGLRTADNARWIKALFIDMDGYATKREAGEVLYAFLSRTGLAAFGTPYVVSSGGGLHVYWPFEEAVQVVFWKPVAENLKRLLVQEGIAKLPTNTCGADMTVTADAARILRMPGTFNYKAKYEQPRPVRVLSEGHTFDFGALASHIAEQLHPDNRPIQAPVLELPGVRPQRATDASTVKLFENSATSFEPIWWKTEQRKGCEQLWSYWQNAASDGMEPVWRGILSWTKFCDDGETFARQLSAMHPYTEERMQQKLREIKGPYSCVKMDSENPGVCSGCPHNGKITNPLALGREVRTETEAKVVDVPKAAYEPLPPDPEDIVPEGKIKRPDAPRGFSYGINGGIYCRKEDKDAEGNKVTRDVQVLPYDLFVVDMLKQEEDYFVHMAALRPDGVLNVSMPSKCVVSKDETVKFLASQNIIASYGQGNDKNLFDYVRGCVEMASLEKRAVPVPAQCGWQKDGSFVYNYRVFKPDGREIRVPMPGLENINKNTNQMGTLEGWRAFWELLIERKMWTMLAMCLDSFGCALMRFTDYEGFVWHIGSTESGTGKTLTLAAKAGVWGHPVHYRTGKGTSPVAMQQRAGLLNAMPLLVDEITAKSRADMEWAPAFIFDITEGKGKERMEAGANKERVNESTWKLTCTMTSNTHLTDYMSGGRTHSSNGELMRMLEWTPNKPLVWSESEKAALTAMRMNFGLAGEAWIRWIVTNQSTVQEMVQLVHRKLKTEIGFTDEERYWHAGCTTIAAAGLLLGPKFANILAVPVKPVIAALGELVKKGRGVVKRAHRSADDVLNAYTRNNYGQFIIVRKNDGPKGGWTTAWGDGSVADKSTTRQKVLGRVEHNTLQPGFVEYFLEEQLLKQHCSAMSFGYADFKEALQAQWKVTYIKKNMLSGTGGPMMRVNVMHISRRLEDLEDSLSVDEAQAG